MKQSDTVKKLAMAGVLTAVAVVGSLLSFPKFIFISGIRKQVFPGTAYGEYSLCSPLRTGIRTGRGIRGGADPESSGTWKPDGIPGKYDRCIMLWSGLYGIPKTVADLYRRGIRNRNPWRSGCLSGCKTDDGIKSGRFVCIHCAISCFHSSRKYPCIFSCNCAAERRRDQYVQTSGEKRNENEPIKIRKYACKRDQVAKADCKCPLYNRL